MNFELKTERERELVLAAILYGIELGANLDVEQLSHHTHQKKLQLIADTTAEFNKKFPVIEKIAGPYGTFPVEREKQEFDRPIRRLMESKPDRPGFNGTPPRKTIKSSKTN